jgi:hypothetical protein
MDLLIICYFLVLEVMVVLGTFRILDVLLVVPRTFLSFISVQEQQLGWGSRQSVLNVITEDFS